MDYSGSQSSQGLSLLTFNMECSNLQTRHDQLLKLVEIIKSQKTKCICLQDVNLTSLSILKSKLSMFDVIETISSSNSQRSQQVIFYHKDCILQEEYCYDLPTEESKEVLGCKLKYNDIDYDILNVHLEENNENYRAKQLEVLNEIGQESDNSIIVGDLNIYDINEPASSFILTNSKIVDAWTKYGCNSCLRNTTYKPEEKRWYRTARLLHFKEKFDASCVSLLNTKNNKSMVIFNIKSLQ